MWRADYVKSHVHINFECDAGVLEIRHSWATAASTDICRRSLVVGRSSLILREPIFRDSDLQSFEIARLRVASGHRRSFVVGRRPCSRRRPCAHLTYLMYSAPSNSITYIPMPKGLVCSSRSDGSRKDEKRPATAEIRHFEISGLPDVSGHRRSAIVLRHRS